MTGAARLRENRVHAPFTALVVDDEPPARRRLRRLLGEREDVVVVGEAEDGTRAAASLRADPPDLVFLDIQMPGLSGLEVVRAMSKAPGQSDRSTPLIVFVTAFDHYALEAFDVHALDYVLKPFDRDRFHRAVDLAVARLRDRQASVLWRAAADILARPALPRPRGSSALDEEPGDGDPFNPEPAAPGREPEAAPRFLVRRGERHVVVPWRDLEWVEGAGSYARLHLHDGTQHLLRATLGELEARLGRAGFTRVHRSALVRIESVRELHPLFHGERELRLRSGCRVRLSRTYRDRLPLFGETAPGAE